MISRYARNGVFVVIGDVYYNALRLAANLVMTRLLYPEAFGLMVIVNTFITGVQLFSSVGLRGAVILKSKTHEDESLYLSVAWTIKSIRGAILCVITVASASPLAIFYDKPELFSLMLISSLYPLLAGFSSPQMFAAERDIKLKAVIIGEGLAQTSAVIIVVTWIYLFPTVYALAFHAVFEALILTIYSFIRFRGENVRFVLDKKIVQDIFYFGRWILLATVLSFAANQADKLILSRLFKLELLGVYSVAANLAQVVQRVIQSLGSRLLFPAFVEIRQANDSIIKIARMRNMIAVITLPVLLALCVFGDKIIRLLYDERYSSAGWMMQLMAAGGVFSVLASTLNPMLLAAGDARYYSSIHLCKLVSLVAGLYIGYLIADLPGAIVGISFSSVAVYASSIYYARRSGFDRWEADIVIIIGFFVIIFAYWGISDFWLSIFKDTAQI